MLGCVRLKKGRNSFGRCRGGDEGRALAGRGFAVSGDRGEEAFCEKASGCARARLRGGKQGEQEDESEAAATCRAPLQRLGQGLISTISRLGEH